MCSNVFYSLLFPDRKGKKTGIQNGCNKSINVKHTNQRFVLNFEENLTVKSKLGVFLLKLSVAVIGLLFLKRDKEKKAVGNLLLCSKIKNKKNQE